MGAPRRAQTASAVSLPGRLAVRPAVGVVGRDPEMQAIADAGKAGRRRARAARCCSSRARPVWARPPWWPRRPVPPSTAGRVVLFGHCEEDLATPYQLFAEALGHYVTHAPEDQLLAHVDAHGSELSRLVPALASRIPDLPPSKATDADTERFLLFAAVVGLLATGVGGPARRPRPRRPPMGRQGRACFSSATSQPPSRPCGCSCSGPTATASCRRRIRCSTPWPPCGDRTG